MFSQVFDGKSEGTNEDFPMEVIELQRNEFYNSKLVAIGTSVIEFYKKYISESKRFPKLIDDAKKFVCMFGITLYLSSYFRK